MVACQAGVKTALSRSTCPPLTRHPCPQVHQWHPRVSDHPQNGPLPRIPPPQMPQSHGRVAERSQTSPFPVYLSSSATGILPTVLSVAYSRVRPVNYRPSATSIPVTGICEALPRVRPSEIGLFPAFRRFSATGILPTVLSGAWSRVRAVNYRPSATATPATGICEALPRVRPSRNRSFSGTSAGLCHGHPANSALWGMVACQTILSPGSFRET